MSPLADGFGQRARVPWVSAYLLAHVTPLLVSTAIWVLVIGVQPAMVILGPIFAVAAGLMGRTPLALRIRFGVRVATADECSLVVGALAAAPSLRGRGEPRIWVGGPLTSIRALSPRDLALGAGRLEALVAQSGGTTDLVRVSLAMLAPQRVGLPVVRGWVSLYCLPFEVLRRGGSILHRYDHPRGLRRALWLARPALIAVAIAEQVRLDEWAVAVGLAFVGALTYTTTGFDARWRGTVEKIISEARMADMFGAEAQGR